MAETFVQKQVRLVVETQCRELAEHLKPKVPAGCGFALFLFDFGVDGNTAYVSTADRADMVLCVEEWLRRQGQTVSPVTTRVQAATMRSVADALELLEEPLRSPTANAANTIRNVVAHMRRDADSLEANGTLAPIPASGS